MASTNVKEKEEQELGYAKQGTKLYSKMLSKEEAAALAAPSFRVYYGVASAGSVPFLWESQPGTPKSSPSAAALPPLTPPPSYYSAGGKGAAGRKGAAKRSWPAGILPGITLLRRPGRRRTSPWSSCSASSSTSCSSSSMSPVFTVHSSPFAGANRRAFSAGDEEATARCFGMERECERGMLKGCGIAVAVRNALATVVGHKSGR